MEALAGVAISVQMGTVCIHGTVSRAGALAPLELLATTSYVTVVASAAVVVQLGPLLTQWVQAKVVGLLVHCAV